MIRRFAPGHALPLLCTPLHVQAQEEMRQGHLRRPMITSLKERAIEGCPMRVRAAVLLDGWSLAITPLASG
jgi:hypothetical protein